MNDLRPWLIAASSVLGMLAVTDTVAAQGITTGSISGRVSEMDGPDLTGVLVSVTDDRRGTASNARTNDAGRYSVPHLRAGGVYTVEARRLGYRPIVRRGVRVYLDQTVTIDFELEPAPIEVAPLTIEAGANRQFARNRTGTRTAIDEGELAGFASIERQITDYAILSPRTVRVRDGLSAGGQNFRFNSIRIDGALNHDLFGLTDGGIPGGEGNARMISVEAIEELHIFTAPFDVRHSGFTGGLINAVTRSGTNHWEGSVFGHHTNEAWVSELGGLPEIEFNDSRFGWTLGGPILEGRVFLFTNAELQLQDTPAPGPSFATDGPLNAGARAAGVHPDSAERFIGLLGDYGFRNIGTTEGISLENPRTNFLGRVDVVPSNRTRLTLRHSYARTGADQAPIRSLSEFRLSSTGRRFTGSTNSTVAQLFSRFGERWNNEAIFNVQFVRLDRIPRAAFPLVGVDVMSEIDGELVPRTLVAGADAIAQAGNALDQDIFQLTDHLTGILGRHQLTLGIHNELFRFRDRFFPQALGSFRFASLADLEANAPSSYAINTLVPGIENAAVEWSLLSLSVYVQDVWSVTDQLTMSLGMRVDVPVFLDRPRANREFDTAFGFGTDQVPEANPRIQPRIGFNWIGGGTWRTQLRGGAGLFSGRPSFVWLSNAFRNTGNMFAFLVCPGPAAPRLDSADFPDSPPQQCADGTTPSQQLTTIDILDPDFGFPLDFKLSVGVDRELPRGLTASAEVLYSQAVDQPFLEEVNLVDQPVGFDAGQGNRPLFGAATPAGFDPARKRDDFAHVVRLTNHSGDRALLLTVGLRRPMGKWLRLRSSYTYSDVDGRQALFFPLAPFGFAANPIRANPNNPELATSPFERRHQFVLSATANWTLGNGFDLSLTPQYFASSGAPYSYTVQGDVNGDGYRSDALRIGRDNDLIYVPNSQAEMAFRSSADAAAFDAFLESEPCLRAQRGQLMRPQSCFAPWRQRWDLRGVIGLSGEWGRAELVIDVINLFADEFLQPRFIDRGNSILRLAGRVDDDADAPLLFDYIGPTDRAGLFERIRPESQRRFQLGLRYRF